MPSDIEIAQAARLHPVVPLIERRLGVPASAMEPYGHYKAKLSLDYIAGLADRPDGHLVLVTAITPTPPGEGKTTTTVGLGDALNRIGQRAIICVREPSLGPCFGMKGGATGGGRSQVLPMEDINLHFTGDFHAIALANNLLAAMLDNHVHHGNRLDIDVRRIAWKRVVDMNDRALRDIVVSLGGTGNGYPREDGFNIVVASEVMAILCLATSLADLKARLGRIVVGYSRSGAEITAKDLKCDGAMTALLKDAIKPNLVQTLEGNPAIIHGGPFANIAHGCNSVIATQTALKLGDYVVTEAGFGADLGAEKFIDIKCRQAGLKPACAVIVATIRAIKFHGGVAMADMAQENVDAVRAGLANLERHVRNVRDVYGLPCVVSINHFTADTVAELAVVFEACKTLGVPCVEARHWSEGGAGAEALARIVVGLCAANDEPGAQYVYDHEAALLDKIDAVARRVYGAAGISVDDKVRRQLQAWTEAGYGRYPVCIAKTQYSFSTDPNLKGAPSGHWLPVREVRLSAGAGFVVAICGEIMTMPGLPQRPAAENIDVDEDGNITGLF